MLRELSWRIVKRNCGRHTRKNRETIITRLQHFINIINIMNYIEYETREVKEWASDKVE